MLIVTSLDFLILDVCNEFKETFGCLLGKNLKEELSITINGQTIYLDNYKGSLEIHPQFIIIKLKKMINKPGIIISITPFGLIRNCEFEEFLGFKPRHFIYRPLSYFVHEFDLIPLFGILKNEGFRNRAAIRFRRNNLIERPNEDELELDNVDSNHANVSKRQSVCGYSMKPLFDDKRELDENYEWIEITVLKDSEGLYLSARILDYTQPDPTSRLIEAPLFSNLSTKLSRFKLNYGISWDSLIRTWKSHIAYVKVITINEEFYRIYRS